MVFNLRKKPKHLNRILAGAVLLCFTAIFVLSAVFAVLHAGHRCAEPICPICPAILQNQKLLRQLAVIGVITAIGIFAMILRRMIHAENSSAAETRKPSLVASKTRLNN
jgi:uncharacterized membrane protein